jgi:hypothetical protein
VSLDADQEELIVSEHLGGESTHLDVGAWLHK